MKLNVTEIEEVIIELGLVDSRYSVYMGGALVVMGYKVYTNDLDLVVGLNDFERLFHEYKVEKVRTSTLGNDAFDIVIRGHNVEIFASDMFRFEEIAGVKCQPKKDIIALKKKLGRVKDIIDLKTMRMVDLL